jgi:hypothetical protein
MVDAEVQLPVSLLTLVQVTAVVTITLTGVPVAQAHELAIFVASACRSVNCKLPMKQHVIATRQTKPAGALLHRFTAHVCLTGSHPIVSLALICCARLLVLHLVLIKCMFPSRINTGGFYL